MEDSKLFVMMPDPLQKGQWKPILRGGSINNNKGTTGSSLNPALGGAASGSQSARLPNAATKSGTDGAGAGVGGRNMWGSPLPPTIPRERKPRELPPLSKAATESMSISLGINTAVPKPPVGGGGAQTARVRPTKKKMHSTSGRGSNGEAHAGDIDPESAGYFEKEEALRLEEEARARSKKDRTDILTQLSDFDTRLETKYALVSGMADELLGEGGNAGPGGSSLVGGGGRNTRVSLANNVTGGNSRKTRKSNKRGGGDGVANSTEVGGSSISRSNDNGKNPNSVRAPIYGLLAGISAPQLRLAHDRLCLERPKVVTVGMSVSDFRELLSFLVPQMPLSSSYVEKMMEHFDTTVNNATRRLSLVNFISQYCEGGFPDVEKNVRLFWNTMENPETQQVHLSSLKEAEVWEFLKEKDLSKGRPKMNWSRVGKALSLDPRVEKMQQCSATKLDAVERRKYRERKMKKKTQFTKRFVNIQADRDIFSIFTDPGISTTVEGGGVMSLADVKDLGSSGNAVVDNPLSGLGGIGAATTDGAGSEIGGKSPSHAGGGVTREGSSGNFNTAARQASSGNLLGTSQSASSATFNPNDPTEPCFCLTLAQLRVLIYGSEELFSAFSHSLWIPPKTGGGGVVSAKAQ